MDNITKEIEQLAEDIFKSSNVVRNLSDSLRFPNKAMKNSEKLSMGFNYFDMASKQYAFRRFYKFADESLLSEKAKNLYKNMNNAVEEVYKQIQNPEDLPQEIKDYLNK